MFFKFIFSRVRFRNLKRIILFSWFYHCAKRQKDLSKNQFVTYLHSMHLHVFEQVSYTYKYKQML